MEDGPSPRAASQCASNRIKPHQTTCVTAARLFEWMGSFTARQPPRAVWSVEECTRFAALREYELLQLLSRDKKALTTARRFGLSLSHPQPQPPSKSTAVGGGTAMPNAPAPAVAPVSNGPNARQRRSAVRSAQRHAARRAQICSRSMLAIIYIVRLRRFVRGTLGFPSSDCIGHCYIWLRLLLERRIRRAPELRLLQLE